MKISVSKKKWYAKSHISSFERLAKHCMTHYPKDVVLHRAVKGCFKSMDACGAKLWKASKTTPKRRTMKRRTVKRTTARRASPKRTATRRKMARRSAPKRRTTARRTVRRTTRRRAA
jgi:hypothetical protein